MKLGPIHIIRDLTFRRLQSVQSFWKQFAEVFSSAPPPSSLLSEQVLSHVNGLIHSPLGAQIATARFQEPDPADALNCEATERVITAYRRALADEPTPPAPCIWERLTREKRGFLDSLARGDIPVVQRAFASLFRGPLVWGLGQVHESHPELLRQSGGCFLHLKFTDALVNLAEAVGTARVTNSEQDGVQHLQPLNVNLEALWQDTVRRMGFEPSFPEVAGAYGFDLGGRLVTIDSLVHGYTVWRLRQLGAARDSRIVEIGGGYGCLAALAQQAGLTGYTILDLPWVNALQGYFLIRALPAGSVRLYGETSGNVQILPYWKVTEVPDRSADYLVNTDSLPEMGMETARHYAREIHRALRGLFLSINQEAKSNPGTGYANQGCVREIMEEHGGFRTLARHRAWMRGGYVEELFQAIR